MVPIDPRSTVPATQRGQANTLSSENHMEVFARLARVRQGEMHGTPGDRKKKRS